MLRLAELPKEKLEAEIRKIIENEKAAKKKAAKKAKDNETGPDLQIMNTTTTAYSSTDLFIFDNQSLLGKEYNEFLKRWGNRKLTDNWRITSIKKDLNVEPENPDQPKENLPDKKGDNSNSGDNAPDDLKKYYTGIPFNAKDKELANKKILESHFEAGKIYNEKLKEYKEAIYHFEEANNRYPVNIYEAEIFYYLTLHLGICLE